MLNSLPVCSGQVYAGFPGDGEQQISGHKSFGSPSKVARLQEGAPYINRQVAFRFRMEAGLLKIVLRSMLFILREGGKAGSLGLKHVGQILTHL